LVNRKWLNEKGVHGNVFFLLQITRFNSILNQGIILSEYSNATTQ